jgi:hypothetical protein
MHKRDFRTNGFRRLLAAPGSDFPMAIDAESHRFGRI